MEMVSQDVGDSRLLELSDILDVTQHYAQNHFFFPFGSPSCALGHWLHHRGFRKNKEIADQLSQTRCLYNWAQREFHLEYHQAYALFSGYGCGNAGSNGRQAAAFIRQFVASRNRPKPEPIQISFGTLREVSQLYLEAV